MNLLIPAVILLAVLFGTGKRARATVPSREKKKIRLVNAAKRARQFPDDFKIPSESDRGNLVPGDSAKVILVSEGEMGERIWVLVTRRRAPAGVVEYKGTLDNTPVVYRELGYGDTVSFLPRNVIDIIKDKGE